MKLTVHTAKDWLKDLLRIDSVETTSAPNAPFGVGIRACLDYSLQLMASLGFKTKDGDGYYGYGEIGDGELFGVLCHLDTVPIGDGWTHDPLAGNEIDNRIYGRGALDDKGPFAACLFAAAKLLEEGKTPKKRLRFILGCDEESGWLCMDEYAKREEMPSVGFSPDGDFPVIHCEKGIVYHEIVTPMPSFVVDFCAGSRANMVPNRAKIILSRQPKVEEYVNNMDATLSACDCTLAFSLTTVTLETSGVSAHGSHPENGVNAIVKLCKPLCGLDSFFETIYRSFSDNNGKNLGLYMADKQSGELTVNLGVVRATDGNAVFQLDVRHPVSFDKETVTEKLSNSGIGKVTQGFFHLPLYLDKDHPLIKSLLASYNKVTGEHAMPIAIGGGTYARVLPVGAAFGPCFPGGNNGMHCADEYMDIADFSKMIEIYYDALSVLCF